MTGRRLSHHIHNYVSIDDLGVNERIFSPLASFFSSGCRSAFSTKIISIEAEDYHYVGEVW